MKLKIVSNGHLADTHIVNADTGETVENVVSIHWIASIRHDEWFGQSGLCQCIVEFVDLALDVSGEQSTMSIEELRQRLSNE